MNVSIPIDPDSIRGVDNGTVEEVGTDGQQLVYKLTINSRINAREVTNDFKNRLPSDFDVECVEDPIPTRPNSLTITVSR